MSVSTMPLVVAWLLALALNLMLWGQELWLRQGPGILCLVQLGILLPLFLLTFKTLKRQLPVNGYRAELVGTSGAAVTLLNLLLHLHPESDSAQVMNRIPWIRSSEFLGPLPSGLLAPLLYTCQIHFQLQAYWELSGTDLRDHSA